MSIFFKKEPSKMVIFSIIWFIVKKIIIVFS